MRTAWARFADEYRKLPQSTTPVLVIVFCVLFGNIIYLSGLSNINPISWTAGISHVLCNLTCGRPMIDPNAGYITQPLGHLAATDLLHGHLPWWNYFEGLGQPLAGEMQSSALFPLTILFALPSGLLWFHVSLEVIAGVSTYFLARRLSIPVVIATGAGALFALNGTFSWLGNAVLNPVAFLPMLLLGIEIIYDNAKGGSRKGWYVAALALALSIYAGFPEVAYFDGLFCAGWALTRFFSLPKPSRLVAARRLGLAGLVGTVLSLPILIPFYDFLKVANIGAHAAGGESTLHLPLHGASMFVDPYVYGTIFSNSNAYSAWGGIGGYFTVSVVALALLGLFGSQMRPLRIFLGAWALFGTLSIFNVAYLRELWNVLPLAQSAALSRYIMPSCELALILLAVLGIKDFATDRRAKRLFNVTTLVALALLLWAVFEAGTWNAGVPHTTKTRIFMGVLDAVPFIAVATLLVLGRFAKTKVAPLLVTILLVGESLVMFQVPTVGAAKQINTDMTPIQYLQTHEGEDRFLDFGVLDANWGSQFDLNSLSAIDLPFPNTFAHLITSKLYPGFHPVNQFVIHAGMTGIVSQEQALVTNFSAYEAASVKYLLISDKVVLLPALATLVGPAVYRDDIVSIYELSTPREFFSTSSGSCTVASSTVNTATVTCPTSGSTLVRTELFMAGWHAFVNGKPATIAKTDGAYQGIPVPAGTSAVTYSFLPPHEKDAVLAGLLAAIFLVFEWIRERVSVSRAPHQR